MTRDRWSVGTVKKYCRGVKVVLSVERDLVFETFSDFVREGKSREDVDDFLNMEKLLKARGLRLEGVARFLSDTMSKVSLPRLLDLYERTKASERSVEEICDGLDVLDDLETQGVDVKVIKGLNVKVEDYGGLKGFLQAVSDYKALGDLSLQNLLVIDKVKRKQAEYDKLEVQLSLLEAQSMTFVSTLDFAKTLVEEYKFDVFGFKTLVEAAEKYGTVSEILYAILRYGTSKELKKYAETLQFDITKLREDKVTKEAELLSLDNFIEKANRSIGNIEASHGKSLTIQAIVDLIYDTDILIDHSRFTRTVFLFLVGVKSYLKKNRGEIPGWDPTLESIFAKNVEFLQDIL